VFKKGTNDKTLVLLHGTGGNEKDLLAIGEMIDPEANLLGIKGNVSEYGMARFFKRKSMGVFDEENLVEEAENLKEILIDYAKHYRFDSQKMIAIGYSNGANMASAIALLFGKVFSKMILFHPMVPIRNVKHPDLDRMQVFIGAGVNDHMMPEHEVSELTQMFESANAQVDVFWTSYGHQLSKEELDAAKRWYDEDDK
jgi:phospholipase/carboxylesterase